MHRHLAPRLPLALFAVLLSVPRLQAQEPGPTGPSSSTPPSPRIAAVLREQPLLAGAAWYPEQWPEARWDADLALMQKAHLHVVRVAEFAWSTMEPAEGQFDFTWLDHAIAAAARHDIKVVLGTPTAAPPVWLTSKYPDTLRVEEDGQRAEHGNRAQESFTNPTYRRFAARIAEEMAKRYGHNPNVIGWQIDNELSEVSFDRSAKADFQAWLKARYGSIAELNRKWATAYWSQTYDTFDQVPVHSHNENPALLLDWKRFVTDTWISYANNQIDVMRPHLLPTQWITTNTMGWFPGFDHYKLHKVLDLAAWDDYVGDGKLDPFVNSASHDLVRGFKQQNFWVMETQPAFVNWAPVNAALPRGVVREMAWQAVGHGADAVLYWQWRSALNGQEEYHGVLVGADGTPVPVYDEVAQLAGEFERVGKAFEGTSPVADVAILQDYDSHWAIDFQKHTNRFDYQRQITDLYRALAPDEGGGTSTIDLIPTGASLSRYKIVFAPALNVLPEATAKHLLDYVKGGGMLVLGTRSGMKREDNGLQPERQPGPLADALGGRVAQFYALNDPVPVLRDGAPAGTATVWAEQLQVLNPETKTLLTYGTANGWLDEQPAALRHSVGKGVILYLGAELEVPALRSFVLPLLTERGVQPLLAGLPAGVELMQRVGEGRRVWVVENHGDTSAHVDLGQRARNLLDSSSPSSTLDLPAHGVAVLSLKASR